MAKLILPFGICFPCVEEPTHDFEYWEVGKHHITTDINQLHYLIEHNESIDAGERLKYVSKKTTRFVWVKIIRILFKTYLWIRICTSGNKMLLITIFWLSLIKAFKNIFSTLVKAVASSGPGLRSERDILCIFGNLKLGKLSWGSMNTEQE